MEDQLRSHGKGLGTRRQDSQGKGPAISHDVSGQKHLRTVGWQASFGFDLTMAGEIHNENPTTTLRAKGGRVAGPGEDLELVTPT
jgi:hypothetical protein